MRYCPTCREYKNTDDALFCEVCGAALEDLSQVNTVALPKNACFCPHCGAAETRKLMSRCAHCSGGNGGDDSFAPSMPASSGGCAGCSGGNCATCGH